MLRRNKEPVVEDTLHEDIQALGHELETARIENARIEAERDMEELKKLEEAYHAQASLVYENALAGRYKGFIEPDQLEPGDGDVVLPQPAASAPLIEDVRQVPQSQLHPQLEQQQAQKAAPAEAPRAESLRSASKAWDVFDNDELKAKTGQALPWLKDAVDTERRSTPKPLAAIEAPVNAEAPLAIEAAKPDEAETPKAAEGYYNEKKVQVVDALPKPDGNGYALVVMDDDGKVETIHENELKIKPLMSAEEQAAENTEAEPARPAGYYFEGKLVTISNEIPAPNGEIYVTTEDAEGNKQVAYKSMLEYVKPEGTEAAAEVKTWYGKAKEQFGMKFWSVVYAAKETLGNFHEKTTKKAYGKLLNVGTSEDLSEEENQKLRDRNRHRIMLGTAVVGGAFIGSLITVGAISGVNALNHVNDAAANINEFPKGQGPLLTEEMKNIIAGDGAQSGTGEIVNPIDGMTPLKLDSLQGGAEAAGAAFVAYSNPNFDIPNNMGGIEFFQKLGLGEQDWYNNEQYLRTHFQGDFYQNPNESVRFSHAGWLSPEAQQYIESLRG